MFPRRLFTCLLPLYKQHPSAGNLSIILSLNFVTETRTQYSRPAQPNNLTVTSENRRKTAENHSTCLTDLDTGKIVGKPSVTTTNRNSEKSMEPNQQLADELLAALQFDQLAELEMALQQENDNCSQQQQQQQQPQQQQIQMVTEEAVLPPSPVAEEIVDLSNAHADVKPNLDELLWLTQTVGVGLQNQASFNSVGSADLQALLGPCPPATQPQHPEQPQPQRVNISFLTFNCFPSSKSIKKHGSPFTMIVRVVLYGIVS